MRSVLSGVQSKECVHQVFCQTIVAILDWSHVTEIWPRLLVSAPSHMVHGGTNWKLTAVKEVTEEHRRREEREDERRRKRA